MNEYLRALEPVLTHQQHDRTKAIVKQFISPSGIGTVLHQYLVDKRDADDNWVNFNSYRIDTKLKQKKKHF